MIWLSLVFVVLGPLLGLALAKIATEELKDAERYLRFASWILWAVILIFAVLFIIAAFSRGFDVSLYLITISLLFLEGLCLGILFYHRRWNNETKE